MSFRYYAVSDDKGEILQIYGTQDTFTPCGPEVSDTTHYLDVETGVLEEKRELEPTTEVNGFVVTLSDVPIGTKVSTNNVEGVVDSDSIDIRYDVPGTYNITLGGLVEYLEKTLEVVVGDP